MSSDSHAGEHWRYEGSEQLNSGFEVFHTDDYPEARDSDGAVLDEGWYWWVCQPGCLPDSEPFGPFLTSHEAFIDANEAD